MNFKEHIIPFLLVMIMASILGFRFYELNYKNQKEEVIDKELEEWQPFSDER